MSTSRSENWSDNSRLILLLISLGAYFVAVMQGCFCHGGIVPFAYDSDYYREAISLLTLFFKAETTPIGVHTSHPFGGEQLSSLSTHVALTGPVLPLVFGVICTMVHASMSSSDWRIVIVVQSVFFATTVYFIGLLGQKISGNKKVGILSCLLYALYPPAIISTTRLLTEPLAGVLTVMLIFALTLRPGWRVGFGAGLLSALILMTKTALVVSVLLCVIAYSNFKPSLSKVASIACGFLLTMFAWAAVSMAIFGHPMFVADRGAAINLAVGMDLETGGVAPIKLGPFSEICFDVHHPIESSCGLFRSFPLQYARLFVWKAEQMLMFPWNDFGQRCLGLSTQGQRLVHLFYVNCATIGMIALGFKLFKSWRIRAETFPIVLSLSFVVGNVTWLLFATCNRYLFMLTPLIALYAAVGLFSLFNSIVRGKWRSVLLGSVIFTCLTGAFILSYDSMPYLRHEHHCSLAGRSYMTRDFELPPADKLKGLQTVLLIVDGIGFTSDTNILVNGHTLSSRLIPLAYFANDYYSFIATDELITAAKRASLPSWENCRYWRAAQIPTYLLKDGTNTISLLQSNGSSTLFVDDDPSEARLPALFQFSDWLFFIDPDRMDGRPNDPAIHSTRKTSEHWFIGDDLHRRTYKTGRPRMRLIFVAAEPMPSALAIENPLPSKRDIDIEVIPYEAGSLSTSMNVNERMGARGKIVLADDRCSHLVKVPLDHTTQSSAVRIEVAGLARALHQRSNPFFNIIALYDDGHETLFHFVESLHCQATWRPLFIGADINSPREGRLKEIQLQFGGADIYRTEHDPSRAGTEFFNLQLKVIQFDIPKSTFTRLAIY